MRFSNFYANTMRALVFASALLGFSATAGAQTCLMTQYPGIPITFTICEPGQTGAEGPGEYYYDENGVLVMPPFIVSADKCETVVQQSTTVVYTFVGLNENCQYSIGVGDDFESVSGVTSHVIVKTFDLESEEHPPQGEIWTIGDCSPCISTIELIGPTTGCDNNCPVSYNAFIIQTGTCGSNGITLEVAGAVVKRSDGTMAAHQVTLINGMSAYSITARDDFGNSDTITTEISTRNTHPNFGGEWDEYPLECPAMHEAELYENGYLGVLGPTEIKIETGITCDCYGVWNVRSSVLTIVEEFAYDRRLLEMYPSGIGSPRQEIIAAEEAHKKTLETAIDAYKANTPTASFGDKDACNAECLATRLRLRGIADAAEAANLELDKKPDGLHPTLGRAVIAKGGFKP